MEDELTAAKKKEDDFVEVEADSQSNVVVKAVREAESQQQQQQKQEKEEMPETKQQDPAPSQRRKKLTCGATTQASVDMNGPNQGIYGQKDGAQKSSRHT